MVNKGEEATYSAETDSADEGEKDMSIEDSANESYSINEFQSETEVYSSILFMHRRCLRLYRICMVSNCSYTIQTQDLSVIFSS